MNRFTFFLALLVLVTSSFTQLGTALAATKSEVAQAQGMLNRLGYNAGVVDGLWGGTTRSALELFYEEVGGGFDGSLGLNEIEELKSETSRRGLNDVPKVSWDFRSGEVSLGHMHENAFDALDSVRALPQHNLNTLTLTMRCSRLKIDSSAKLYYPLRRSAGCDVYNGFWEGASTDVTDVMILEAHQLGLSVNLKPMFLGLIGHHYAPNISEQELSEYSVPVEEFFLGNGAGWDGYIDKILVVAEYAERMNVEYLTIGTELGNLNPKITESSRWEQIIKDIRSVYSGKLIYKWNLGGRGTAKQFTQSEQFFKQLDIIGVNYFPNRIMNGRALYSAEEVAAALEGAKVDQLRLFKIISDMSRATGKPIVMTETAYPAWEGSANFMFRVDCDYENKGKTGWIFTKGALAAKVPSFEASRVLALGWMKAFSNQNWVSGVVYTFWHRGFLDAPETTDPARILSRKSWSECASDLWSMDTGVKEMIREFHTQE